MIQVWLIDENGYYINESKFVEEVAENMTTVPLSFGYVKPLFNGEEWIEGATEEEIKYWKDSQATGIFPEKSEHEIITEDTYEVAQMSADDNLVNMDLIAGIDDKLTLIMEHLGLC